MLDPFVGTLYVFMDIIRLPAEMTAWSDSLIAKGKSIALVPTMGYFHEGHLSLMRMAANEADTVVVSLFVNPLQFGPNEDLARYPRDFDRDVDLAKQQDADVLFAPEPEAMYPEGAQAKVVVEGLTSGLCGATRPGHFEGVTTVVAKLFNIVKPHKAVFGQKDFQQLAVIKQMVRDLNWSTRVVSHPIVREADGLAMSSRNTYLSDEERSKALCLYKAIQRAKKLVQQGANDAEALVTEIVSFLNTYEGVSVEYVNIVESDSLAAQKTVNQESVLALAVKLGCTRLIDNAFLFENNQ